jgi:hypothetical protein
MPAIRPTARPTNQRFLDRAGEFSSSLSFLVLSAFSLCAGAQMVSMTAMGSDSWEPVSVPLPLLREDAQGFASCPADRFPYHRILHRRLAHRRNYEIGCAPPGPYYGACSQSN